MDETAESTPQIPPYTGRVTGAESRPAAVAPPASAGPVIHWSRMAIVQFASGILVAFLIPLLLFVTSGSSNDIPGLIVVVLFASLLIGTIGGGLPFLGARLTHAIVTRNGRGAAREVLAVAGGALLGSALLAIVGVMFTGSPSGLIVLLVIGAPSAIGFTVWVLVAWARRAVPSSG